MLTLSTSCANFSPKPNLATQAGNSVEKSKANFADRTVGSNPTLSAIIPCFARDCRGFSLRANGPTSDLGEDTEPHTPRLAGPIGFQLL